MNYFLFKLSFHTPCHFGSSDSALSLYTSEDHFCADTLFSALCHTARTLYGNSGVEALIEKAQKDQLFLSDAMPWCGERYYLPRPFLTARTDGHTAGADRKAGVYCRGGHGGLSRLYARPGAVRCRPEKAVLRCSHGQHPRRRF